MAHIGPLFVLHACSNRMQRELRVGLFCETHRYPYRLKRIDRHSISYSNAILHPSDFHCADTSSLLVCGRTKRFVPNQAVAMQYETVYESITNHQGVVNSSLVLDCTLRAPSATCPKQCVQVANASKPHLLQSSTQAPLLRLQGTLVGRKRRFSAPHCTTI